MIFKKERFCFIQQSRTTFFWRDLQLTFSVGSSKTLVTPTSKWRHEGSLIDYPIKCIWTFEEHCSQGIKILYTLTVAVLCSARVCGKTYTVEKSIRFWWKKVYCLWLKWKKVYDTSGRTTMIFDLSGKKYTTWVEKSIRFSGIWFLAVS